LLDLQTGEDGVGGAVECRENRIPHLLDDAAVVLFHDRKNAIPMAADYIENAAAGLIGGLCGVVLHVAEIHRLHTGPIHLSHPCPCRRL